MVGRSEVGRAHVRGTDAYIALGEYPRVVNIERNVADGPTVVGWFWQGRSEVGRAHVRGTDAYIALGDWGRSVCI